MIEKMIVQECRMVDEHYEPLGFELVMVVDHPLEGCMRMLELFGDLEASIRMRLQAVGSGSDMPFEVVALVEASIRKKVVGSKRERHENFESNSCNRD